MNIFSITKNVNLLCYIQILIETWCWVWVGGKTKLHFLLYIFSLNSAAEYRSSSSHFVSLSIKKNIFVCFHRVRSAFTVLKKKKDSCSVPLQCTRQMTKKSQESLWRKAVFGQLRCSLYLRSMLLFAGIDGEEREEDSLRME